MNISQIKAICLHKTNIGQSTLCKSACPPPKHSEASILDTIIIKIISDWGVRKILVAAALSQLAAGDRLAVLWKFLKSFFLVPLYDICAPDLRKADGVANGNGAEADGSFTGRAITQSALPGSAGTQQAANSFSFPCFLPLFPLKDKSEPLHSPRQNHKEISDQWKEKGKLDKETSPS